MQKIYIGILVGTLAGIIDVIPMIIQHLTWDANLSAFFMWVVVGIFIASVEWKINPMLKGIIVSFLTIFPCAVLIGCKEPVSLIPISVMTLLLGALSGFLIHKFAN